MAATSVETPQIVPLLMKAIGWQGGSIHALQTLVVFVTWDYYPPPYFL
ncbi:hypothetical protein RchiOBHm_Chr2g0088851 [Rosa chinensis]|uniref:Uncharacterized protein n=1 Tax=Rosa chinensis TaxID=74649 RepID=A0A2P6RJ14_ROSCH|nr:hypothetical protein RchiOBHm_Chr2g0088851 [Rosa chinensis]